MIMNKNDIITVLNENNVTLEEANHLLEWAEIIEMLNNTLNKK